MARADSQHFEKCNNASKNNDFYERYGVSTLRWYNAQYNDPGALSNIIAVSLISTINRLMK